MQYAETRTSPRGVAALAFAIIADGRLLVVAGTASGPTVARTAFHAGATRRRTRTPRRPGRPLAGSRLTRMLVAERLIAAGSEASGSNTAPGISTHHGDHHHGRKARWL